MRRVESARRKGPMLSAIAAPDACRGCWNPVASSPSQPTLRWSSDGVWVCD